MGRGVRVLLMVASTTIVGLGAWLMVAAWLTDVYVPIAQQTVGQQTEPHWWALAPGAMVAVGGMVLAGLVVVWERRPNQ